MWIKFKKILNLQIKLKETDKLYCSKIENNEKLWSLCKVVMYLELRENIKTKNSEIICKNKNEI